MGLVLSAGPDSRGVAAASVHMPSSWDEDEVFERSLALLDRFVGQVAALGGASPRLLVGGDWNIAFGFLNGHG